MRYDEPRLVWTSLKRARRSVRMNPIPNPDPSPKQAPQMSLKEA
jgi:hypothetical protein